MMARKKGSNAVKGWTSSRGVRRTRGFVRRHWGALLVGAVVLALVATAITRPGLTINDAHLNEGAVYVQKAEGALIGNLNMQSAELAQATTVGAENFTILQEGRSVVVWSTSPNQLVAYDAAANQLGGPTTLPNNATVVQGGNTLAVANPDNGRVWFNSVSQMLKTDFQQTKAQLEVGDRGLVTVTRSGLVIGLDVARSRLVRPAQGDRPESTIDLPFKLAPGGAGYQLSAVGENAVVLDRNGQQVWVEGMKAPTAIEAGATAELAAPAETASVGVPDGLAVYSTRAGVNVMTKDGARSLSGQLPGDTVITPLVVNGCVHGASGSKFVKRCGGQDRPTVLDIPEIPGGAQLRFATNRGQVVLNDVSSGYIWLVDQGMKLIKDWTRVTPAKQKENKESDDTQKVVNPDRSKNRAPTAKDDLRLKARVGRSTLLPVLDNDSDPDGDILTIEKPPTLKGGAKLDLVSGGTALQLTLPAEYSGAITFRYTISDGRGLSSSANVRVNPISANQATSNEPPKQIRPNEKVRLLSSQSATKRALLDWRDPDGDDLVLVDAQVDGSEDEVTFTSDGTVTFQDVGKTTGLKKVKLSVSDGAPGARPTVAEMQVEVVKNPKDAPPVANGDQVTARVDQEVTVNPLENDQGQNLVLRDLKIEKDAGNVKAVPNYQDNSIKVTASRPGTYYIQYQVFNGQISTGLIRVDVPAGGGSNHPPVAARDVVLMPPGGSVLVDPLANDSDPDGDVLVLQSVGENDDLKIVMEQRRFLTITPQRRPTAPITLHYYVSDGTYQVVGTIVVIPIEPTGSERPKAVKDSIQARAGSIVSIPVMANDSSPLGLPLKLDKLVEGPLDRTWIDGDRIRMQVPANSTSVAVTYQIRDSEGRTNSAVATVSVTSTDAANEPPKPSSVEARVLAGSTSKILIPLDDIDKNGDPVRLLGLYDSPRLGRVTKVGEGYLTYEAFKDSVGTDAFKYQVVDALGAKATGEIRVGVAPPVGTNLAPVGTDDTLTVRPGRPVHLQLLTNDYDPDGDAFALVKDKPVDFDLPTQLTQDRAGITFKAPQEAGTTPGKYYMRDARGALGNGTFQVTVDPKAKNVAPVANDDLVDVSKIAGKDSIEVEPLKNDYDPDGTTQGLKVSVDDPTGKLATVNPTKGTIAVRITTAPQQVRYTITDSEGATSSAVVAVPGRQDEVPLLKDPNARITVMAGDTVDVNLKDYIRGTNGRSVVMNSVDRAYVTIGNRVPTADRVQWTPPSSYEGPAAMVLEVKDLVPTNDKTAKVAVISIPAVVTAAPGAKKKDVSDKVASGPVLNGPAPVMTVGAGEPQTRFDIKPFYRDPLGTEFRFDKWKSAGAVPKGLDWRQGDGASTIIASAAEDAKAGSTVTIEGTVTNAVNASNVAKLTIKVVGSTRPRPTTVTDVVNDGQVGKATSVSPLSNDKSNLLKNTKLTLKGARSVDGNSSVTVKGDQVSITPNKVGTATVSYTVGDATNDPSRDTDGTIRLAVRDKPGKPGIPVKDSVGDGKVALHWSDGALNGLPVKSRTVQATPSGGGAARSQKCETNTCTVTGLTNGKPYTFVVSQGNDLGETSSGSSAPMTPDVRPDPPGRPQVEFGDKELKISWGAASSKGSPVTKYLVKNETLKQTREVLQGTNYVWKGLTNGVNYTFTVQASNQRANDTDNVTGLSDPSAASTPEHPTGPPPAPLDVSAQDGGDKDGGRIDIRWNAPKLVGAEANDPILSYDVYVRSSGSGHQLVAAKVTERSLSWTKAKNGVVYNFVVAARNRGPNAGALSAPSPDASSYGAPTEPKGAQLSFGDGTATITSIPQTSNGRMVDYWDGALVTVGGSVVSGTQKQVKPGDGWSGLTNGVQYYAQLTPVSGTKRGPTGYTSAGTPKGAPGAVKITTQQAFVKDGGSQRKVALEVPRNGANSTVNGSAPKSVTLLYRVNGGGWQPSAGGLSPVLNVPIGPEGETIEAKATAPGVPEGEVTTVKVPAAYDLKAEKTGLDISLVDPPSGPITCEVTGAAYVPGSYRITNETKKSVRVGVRVTDGKPPASGAAFTVKCLGTQTAGKFP